MKQENVIVRADRAGVFFGDIESRIGSEVEMSNVRRLYFWAGANSLSQLAVDGVADKSSCKFTVVVPFMTILGVIEIIPCTQKATDCIKSVNVWKK